MTSCHTHTQIITSVHPNTLCREQNGDCIIQQKQIFNALLRVTVHADNVHAGGVPTTCVQVRAGCGRKSLAHTTVITGKHSVRSGDCDSQWLSGAHLRQLTNRAGGSPSSTKTPGGTDLQSIVTSHREDHQRLHIKSGHEL